MKHKCVYMEVARDVIIQGNINLERLNFCTVGSNICGPSVWNWLHVSFLAARTLSSSPRLLEN